METATLPLFKIDNSNLDTAEAKSNRELVVSEEKIVTPLTQVLDHVLPDPEKPKQKLEESKSFTQSLDELFPEQQYDEKNVQRAKEILGPLADEFSSDELKDMVSEIQYLVNSWLDDFERDIFDGLTLKELLHENGSL